MFDYSQKDSVQVVNVKSVEIQKNYFGFPVALPLVLIRKGLKIWKGRYTVCLVEKNLSCFLGQSYSKLQFLFIHLIHLCFLFWLFHWNPIFSYQSLGSQCPEPVKFSEISKIMLSGNQVIMSDWTLVEMEHEFSQDILGKVEVDQTVIMKPCMCSDSVQNSNKTNVRLENCKKVLETLALIN